MSMLHATILKLNSYIRVTEEKTDGKMKGSIFRMGFEELAKVKAGRGAHSKNQSIKHYLRITVSAILHAE